MIDWEKKAKKLENKVLILQDTLETVKRWNSPTRLEDIFILRRQS